MDEAEEDDDIDVGEDDEMNVVVGDCSCDVEKMSGDWTGGGVDVGVSVRPLVGLPLVTAVVAPCNEVLERGITCDLIRAFIGLPIKLMSSFLRYESALCACSSLEKVTYHNSFPADSHFSHGAHNGSRFSNKPTTCSCVASGATSRNINIERCCCCCCCNCCCGDGELGNSEGGGGRRKVETDPPAAPLTDLTRVSLGSSSS